MGKRFPTAPPQYDQSWGNELVRVLESPELSNYKKNGYVPTGSILRTISTGDTLGQTQDVLTTLIKDLQRKGIL